MSSWFSYNLFLCLVCNLGGNWPSTLALWSVDALTWKSCHTEDSIIHETNKCRNPAETLVVRPLS